MATNLAERPRSNLARRLNLSQEKLDLVRVQIAPDAPDDVLEMYFERCRISGFDPFAKMLYVLPRKDRTTGKVNWTFQTSIDGFRSQAEDSGEYDGQDEPRFQYSDRGKLVSASVTVYRKGMSRGVSATADWDEYNVDSPMWRKMPKGQLSKCAEALALRKAFPKKLQGVYVSEEMEQADKPAPALANVSEAPQTPALPPAPSDISIADLKASLKLAAPGKKLQDWVWDIGIVPRGKTTLDAAQKQAAREQLDYMLANKEPDDFQESMRDVADAAFREAVEPVGEAFIDHSLPPPTASETAFEAELAKMSFEDRAKAAVERGKERDRKAAEDEAGGESFALY